jgi:hypothetical protein
MTEGDTESRAEMPEQPWRMMNGNRQKLGIECQTVTATKDMARPRTELLRRGSLEPPYTEPYVRWCGRSEGATPSPPRSWRHVGLMAKLHKFPI